MADRGYVQGELAGIPDDATKRILQRVFDHLLDQQALGAPDHQRKATNFKSYFLHSTTATSTGEFSVKHGLNYAPRLAVQVLDLNTQGAQVVPLTVSRVADSQRVYLKTNAGSTNAAFVLLVE